MKKLIIPVLLTFINFSFVYAKGEAISLVSIPPEGNLDITTMNYYITVLEGAFMKAGYRVLNRQEIRTYYNVDYIMSVELYTWEEGNILDTILDSASKIRITVRMLEPETKYSRAQGIVNGKMKDNPDKLANKVVKDIDKVLKKIR